MYYKLCVVLLLLSFSQYGNASYIYEPYENLVARAELIITGTIFKKQFIEDNPGVFTVYNLKIKEIIKGKSATVEIDVKASGGCLNTGICISSGISYEFEEGDQVFMMLKWNPEINKFESVRSASTVSFVSDDGILYSSNDEFIYNLNRKEKRATGEKPVTIIQVKNIVSKQDK